jgi:hypothetical protein
LRSGNLIPTVFATLLPQGRRASGSDRNPSAGAHNKTPSEFRAALEVSTRLPKLEYRSPKLVVATNQSGALFLQRRPPGLRASDFGFQVQDFSSCRFAIRASGILAT